MSFKSCIGTLHIAQQKVCNKFKTTLTKLKKNVIGYYNQLHSCFKVDRCCLTSFSRSFIYDQCDSLGNSNSPQLRGVSDCFTEYLKRRMNLSFKHAGFQHEIPYVTLMSGKDKRLAGIKKKKRAGGPTSCQ